MFRVKKQEIYFEIQNLRIGTSNQKTKDTLFSGTLKVEENKVLLVF
jgi:hypothetical protein